MVHNMVMWNLFPGALSLNLTLRCCGGYHKVPGKALNFQMSPGDEVITIL